MSLHRHALLTIRNLTARYTDRMFSHERDYSEENSFPRNTQGNTGKKNSDQRKVEKKFEHPSVVPTINACLLRERKQFGVCSGGVVLCDHCGDLSLANPYSRWRVARLLPERTSLSSLDPGIVGTGQEADIQNYGSTLRRRVRRELFRCAKISTASSSRLACWPCAKNCSSSK